MHPEPRKVTVLVPCRNEQQNINPLYQRVRGVAENLANISIDILFVDNASTDGTQKELRLLASADQNVRAILNNRNFGHVRSPFHGLLSAAGDAVIVLPADLQVPPDLISEFILRWKEGCPVVLAQRRNSDETLLFRVMRRAYYSALRRLADVELHENTPGYGLYDRRVIENFRALDDPYPYVRGLVSELGYPVVLVPYTERQRVRGVTKNNLYTLYDAAMLGLTSHSKVPLRLATMLGFAASALSFVVGLTYLVYKLIFWNRFALGVAPVVIGLNMKIVDVPVRYRDRTYGSTNIHRWRHGWLLLRMVLFAARKLKFV